MWRQDLVAEAAEIDILRDPLATTWAAWKPSSIGSDSFTVTALWW